MQSETQTSAASTTLRWTGRIMSGLVVLFMLFDSIIKLIEIAPVTESFVQLGYPNGLARPIGIMELVITALYVIPRTSVLGAVLLTGLYGGAIASHVRVGDPLVSHVLFGVYLGLLAWGGLFLRDPQLRAVFPARRRPA
jgi:hypothetical protein